MKETVGRREIQYKFGKKKSLLISGVSLVPTLHFAAKKSFKQEAFFNVVQTNDC